MAYVEVFRVPLNSIKTGNVVVHADEPRRVLNVQALPNLVRVWLEHDPRGERSGYEGYLEGEPTKTVLQSPDDSMTITDWL
jgi:hypothetical protein